MLAKIHTYTLIEKNHYIFWRLGQIENHISKRCLGKNFLPLMLVGPVTSILGQLVAYTPHVPPYAVPAFAQTPSSADTGLQFAYTKIGVLGGLYQRVSYDSETKSLALSGLAA